MNIFAAQKRLADLERALTAAGLDPEACLSGGVLETMKAKESEIETAAAELLAEQEKRAEDAEAAKALAESAVTAMQAELEKAKADLATAQEQAKESADLAAATAIESLAAIRGAQAPVVDAQANTEEQSLRKQWLAISDPFERAKFFAQHKADIKAEITNKQGRA
jgi:hypothetical protein